MSYEGRSPFKDVMRSVVMGAAMVSPSLLAACADTPPAKPIDVDPPLPPENTNAVATSTPETPVASASAPPNEVVRPRTDPTAEPMHPTRGFSGAARPAKKS